MRYFIALVLILMGTALVLANVGVIDFDMNNAWLYIYPIIFIFFGIKWMIDKIRYNGGSWIFGSFFFLFGSLLLSDRFDLIAFHFGDVLKLWPLLIVYVGFSFIGHSKSNEKVFKDWKGSNKKHKRYNKDFFTVGNHEYSQPNWKVEPMNLKSMAGDFYLDFSKAFIPDEEIPITINALAGDVHILVPENVEFQVDASVKAGDIDIVGQKIDGIQRSMNYKTEDYDNGVRKLNMSIKLKAGSIRVVKV